MISIWGRMSAGRFVVALAAALLISCAGVSHRSNLDEHADRKARGIRYLGTSPYLIAYTDNAGGVTVDLEYLPDRHKLHSAQPFAWLSKTEGKLTFDTSALTGSEDSSDSTDVPKAIIAAGEQVLKAMTEAGRMGFDVGVAANPQDTVVLPQTIPRIAIFKFVRQRDGWVLIGEDGAVMKL